MNINDLSKPLGIRDIDFRIQSINKGGYATILAYKDARVDQQRLDDVCTPLGWKREHTRDNHNCVVSVWDDERKHWVSKEDTGTESNAEKDKGLASDSFKRACFNWGIGRELYDYPRLSVKLNGGGDKPNGVEWYLNEKKKDRYGNPSPSAGYELKLKEWMWFSVFDDDVLTYIGAKDQNGKLRFEHGARPKKQENKK